jgi:dihydroorotate dehydrogenase electron transfer subunit
MLERTTTLGGLPRPARVQQNLAQNHRTRTLVLDLHLPQAQPGQFVMVWLPGLDEKPYSLAGSEPLTLTVAQVGRFSTALQQLRPGERLGIRGPFGQGFTLQGRHALLVGGGYGVAPLAFLAEMLLRGGRQVTVAVGARTAADLLLLGTFIELGAHLRVTTDDGSAGMQGPVTQAVQEIIEKQPIDVVYACGPNGMIDALERISIAAGIPAQLSREAYMRCGTGVCGSCEHNGQLVCRDGPVFTCGALPADAGLRLAA